MWEKHGLFWSFAGRAVVQFFTMDHETGKGARPYLADQARERAEE